MICSAGTCGRRFRQSAVEKIPFEDDQFDHIISSAVLCICKIPHISGRCSRGRCVFKTFGFVIYPDEFDIALKA